MVAYVRDLIHAAGLSLLAMEFVLTVELVYIVYNCKIYVMQALLHKLDLLGGLVAQIFEFVTCRL